MIRALILVLTLAGALLAAPASAAPVGSSKLRMSFESFFADEAGIFSVAFAEEAKRRLKAIHDKSGITIIMVSVPALKGTDSGKVATRIGEGFAQAQKAHNTWAVVMLAPVDRQFTISFSFQNKEATNALRNMNDPEKDQLLREVGSALSAAVVPFFKNNDWEGGMRAGVDVIERQLGADTPPVPSGNPPAESKTAS